MEENGVMADYVKDGTCGSCANYEYAGSNSKGYCSYYGTYYYPDDSCSHWERGSNTYSGGGCFLTTACCEHKGLPDDCYELQTLRKFRDEYLMSKEYGKEIVRLYYEEAPKIVEKIDSKPDKDQMYEKIYIRIKEIVQLIEEGQFSEAVIIYMLMVCQLDRQI